MANQRPAMALVSALGMKRRDFLTSLLAAGSTFAFRDVLAAGGNGGAGDASAFPADIPLYNEDYENWTREITASNLLTCAPRTPADVVSITNWAADNNVRLRPRGMRHGWSPLTVVDGDHSAADMLLADTTQHLNRVELVTYAGIPAVRAEAGVLLEDLMEFLDQQGYGFTAITAVGAVTLGGVLAINGHGSAVPTPGEQGLPQQTYGSLSNRVLSMTAVVWDKGQKRYVLRTFDRSDPEISALLTHLGRSFITEVTMAVEPNHNLRCVSHVEIPASEMFGPPGAGGRSMESFLDSAGRVESIWYPYTDNPWLKVWSIAPTKPLLSREVTEPYNYPFSDNIPDEIVDLAQQMMNGNPQMAPEFGQLTYAVTVAGLAATAGYDLWGSAKNTLMFIKATTIRVHEGSYAVLTRRDQVQRVIHEFTTEYLRLQQAYRDEGKYPINMPIEYRVTGLDHAEDIGLPNAEAASLSALHPREDHPEWDVAVWLSMLTIPGTPDSFPFFKEMEEWMYANLNDDRAAMRPEWSKGWAYTDEAAWANPAILGDSIPQAHRAGRAKTNWDTAVKTLDKLDPKGVFQNEFLAGLM